MEHTEGGLIEYTAPGMGKIDRAWMTTFWETFSDFVIETDARFVVTNLLKKPDSTFFMTDMAGKSFISIVVDGDKAYVESELEILKTPGVPYRRFTFLSQLNRYYRMTLVASFKDGLFTGLRGIAVDVTEQSLKEITLNWQRAIIEGSGDFISIADPGGHVLYTSPGAYRMTGYDPAAGSLPPEKLYTSEHLNAIREQGAPEAVAHGSWTGRGELVKADGTRLPIEHTLFSVRNEKDETILMASTIRDITAFIEHERTILEEQRQTELLASVAMSFSLSDDFDGNIDKAISAIGGYMNVDSMYILRDDKDALCFTCDYLWTAGERYGMYQGRRMPYIDPDTGAYTQEYTLLQEVPLFIAEDMGTVKKGLYDKARKAGTKSMLNLPIRVDGEFWGVIGMNTYAAKRAWSDRDVGFLKTICGILSTTLEKRLMSQRWMTAQSDLQAVLDNVPSAIYWKDTNLRYLGANKRYLNFYGLREKDIIGKHIREVLKYDYVKHVDAADRSLLEAGKASSDAETQHEYMQAIRADGNVRWIANSRALMRDEKGEVTSLLGVFEDITELRENEERVAETLSQLKAVVGNYPGIIWSVDVNRRVTLYDGHFLSAGGKAPPDVIGHDVRDYAGEHPDTLLPDMPEKVELTFAGEPQNWMCVLNSAVFRCNTMPILSGDGRTIGVVGASVDVTSMIKLQTELEEARSAAEAANIAKSEFLSRMSHEIRTPMNAIIGMTQIARSTADAERITNCLGKIDNASKHLLALINDILDISKIEANKLELQEETYELSKCIKNIRNMIAIKVEEKNQAFDLRLGRSLPEFVIGDELRLTQVVINLLGNAIKFTPEGGSIALDVDERAREGDESVVEVRVKDNGIGLSPEQQSRLFQPFEQADGSVTRRFGGTGLGLAICKRIVELMGGTIWTESALGEGSVFAFTVRLRVSDLAAHKRDEADKNVVFVKDISELRILAADDSQETLDYLSHVLGGFSLRCDTARDGAEAVAAVERAAKDGDSYDIVFMDYNMPGMDGISAAKRIMNVMPSGVAFIMISVTDWRDLEREARAAGITRHLVKPFSPSAVLSAIYDAAGIAAERGRRGALAGVDDLSRFTVLLVEDVDINREIVFAMLEDTHINIDYAENGVRAVEMFAAAPGKYDLILMDVQMPEMDGIEATRRIRAMDMEEAREIVIVAMTANVFREDVDKCRDAGMNDHIAKPIDSALLLEKLNDYLFMRGYRRRR